jgi:hypothetical protein
VSVGVGMGMRVPMVPGTNIRQLVPFCGVNVAPGITGMATGGGFWVLVVWSSHTPPWAEISGLPSAEIGKAVNVVIPFVIAVHSRVATSLGVFWKVWYRGGRLRLRVLSVASVAGQCDGTHRAGGSEFSVRSDDASAAG